MPELIERLQTMRANLVEQMANEIAADGDWHAWLPLLAQVQVCIQAVEALDSDAQAATRYLAEPLADTAEGVN